MSAPRQGRPRRVVEGLLRIDVAAEVRKLTARRLKSPGEYAVELVRYAAANRALRVDVEVSSRRFVLTHDGNGPAGDAIGQLIAMFDELRSDAERHQALVALEDEHGLALLAPFSVGAPRVRIGGTVNGRQRAVEFAPGKSPRRIPPFDDAPFAIVVRGRQRDPAAERRLLAEACRHSMIPVRVNGRRINRGLKLDDCLVQVDLRNPRLHGVVGLPNRSDLTRIARLKNGVRFEELVRPRINGLVFHAVVDERDDDLDATWQTLRRAARRLYARAARHFVELGEDGRERALELLLDRYGHTRDEELLAGVPAFARVGGPPANLDQVRRLAEGRQLYAIDRSERARAYEVDDREVLRLDARQRRFLERELRVTLNAPPPRISAGGLGEALKIGWRGLRRWLTDLFGGGPGAPVKDRTLDPSERNLLELVRAEVRSGAFALLGETRPFGIRVRFAERQRRPWVKVPRKDGRSEYRLAREHPVIEQMIEAVEDDPSYIYPALIQLTDGHDGYADAREPAQAAILDRHKANPL
jgi:hypothetical protein